MILAEQTEDLFDESSHYNVGVGTGIRPIIMKDICPCITHARGGPRGFFASWLGRCLTAPDMMALQAAGPTRVQPARARMSAFAVGQFTGNAMAISMVHRICAKHLPAAPLTTTLQDPIHEGCAVRARPRLCR